MSEWLACSLGADILSINNKTQCIIHPSSADWCRFNDVFLKKKLKKNDESITIESIWK